MGRDAVEETDDQSEEFVMSHTPSKRQRDNYSIGSNSEGGSVSSGQVGSRPPFHPGIDTLLVSSGQGGSRPSFHPGIDTLLVSSGQGGSRPPFHPGIDTLLVHNLLFKHVIPKCFLSLSSGCNVF